jgi:hypothetical protein
MNKRMSEGFEHVLDEGYIYIFPVYKSTKAKSARIRLAFSFIYRQFKWEWHCKQTFEPTFLSAFEKIAKSDYKLRHVCPSVPLSFRPSVCPHGTNRLPLDGFSWNLIFQYFFDKLSRKLDSIKADKSKGHFTRRAIYILIISRSGLLRTKCFKVVEKIETNNLCLMTFLFFFRNLAFYEIMWKYTVEWSRPQMTIWRMRILCLIPKATNKRTVCVILIALLPQPWVHDGSSKLRYACIAYLVSDYCTTMRSPTSSKCFSYHIIVLTFRNRASYI